jgi:prepilin-type N-terminal cleavage/methylation domain-containing protein/prepilin-type processing-associated H-X9-DG protein
VFKKRGFTLIELLVVVTIIMLLIAILVPSIQFARTQSYEVVCRTRMRQVHLAIDLYSNEQKGWYPLVPLESNPQNVLIDALDARRGNLLSAMYCPQAYTMEAAAQDIKNYTPKGKQTSVIDTPGNREAGNISYLYWSMKDRSDWRGTDHTKYAEPMDSFRPRWLRHTGPPVPFQPSDPQTPCALQDYRAGDYWVLCDFFRQGAPFPHVRKHASGLNVLFLDGHAEWLSGQPRSLFK